MSKTPPRRFNGKLFLALVAATAALGGAVHLVHAAQLRRGARSLLVQADRAEARGEFAKVEDNLERYLVYRPDDARALVRYGRLLEAHARKDSTRSRAFKTYARAVRLDPDDVTTRRRLVDLGLALAERNEWANPQGGASLTSEVRMHLELLSRANPRDGELKFLLGRCAEGVGKYERAVELYREARALDPLGVDSYAREATVRRLHLNDPVQADAVMSVRGAGGGLLSVEGRGSPQQARAYLARARYCERFAVRDTNPANDVRRALELAPEDIEVLVAAAAKARAKDDLGAARSLLAKATKAPAAGVAVYQALADLELRAGRPVAAVKVLTEGAARLDGAETEGGIVLSWLLADTLIQLGRVKDANAVVDQRLTPRGVRTELLDFLAARARAAEGHWSEAAKILEAVIPAFVGQPELKGLAKRAMILAGQSYERMGSADQRLDAYRRAVGLGLEDDPQWAEARMGLAAAMVDLNRVDEAVEQYRVVVRRLPGAGEAGLELARLQVMQNLRRARDDQRWQEVEQTLDAVEKNATSSAQGVAAGVAIVRAETLAARNQLSPARRVLERALDKYPEDVDLWVALSNLTGREDRPEAALDVLDDARKRLGDRVELTLARIDYWARRGGAAAERALAEFDKAAVDLPAEDQARVWRQLAQAYFAVGREKEAGAVWRRLAERRPDDLRVQLVLFDLAVRSGGLETAARALNDIRRIEGEDGALGHFGRARLLLAQARNSAADRAPLAEARGELERAAARRPSWARVPVALGQLEQLNADPDAALKHYLHAVQDLGDREQSTVGETLQLLYAQGRTAEAVALIQKLRGEQVPLSDPLRQLAARITNKAGDSSRALELLQGTISERATDPAELVLLGQVRWANGRDAEPVLRRAVALAGAEPAPRLALIRYLARTGQGPKALAAAREFEATVPRAGNELPLALACLENGQADRADALLREAVTGKAGDHVPTLRTVAGVYLERNRFDDARPVLERIIQLGGARTDRDWARKTLAQLIAAQRGPDQVKKALETLGLTADGGVTRADEDLSPADLRAKARILAMQPGLAYRKQAIDLLEKLLGRSAGASPDVLLLAQLLEADGDWPGARGRYAELARKADGDPAPLAVLVRARLRHGETDAAARDVEALVKLAPDQPATAEVKARLLVAQGRPEEAARLLTELADKDDARTGPVARLLEALKLDAAAEAMYRRLVTASRNRKPEAVLVLAGFLSRHGRTKEALELLDDEAWEKIPAPLIASESVRALYGARDDDDAPRARVAERLERAIRLHPDAVSLRFDLANLRSLQRRYDDAERIYRELHARDKTLETPLNNLAWMLALLGRRAPEALALAQQAIDLKGEAPDLLDTRAVAYIANGKPDEAVRDLEAAVAVRQAPDLYFHLARAYLAQGRAGDAGTALRRAQDMGLSARSLHPLERENYQGLTSRLASQ